MTASVTIAVVCRSQSLNYFHFIQIQNNLGVACTIKRFNKIWQIYFQLSVLKVLKFNSEQKMETLRRTSILKLYVNSDKYSILDFIDNFKPFTRQSLIMLSPMQYVVKQTKPIAILSLVVDLRIFLTIVFIPRLGNENYL